MKVIFILTLFLASCSPEVNRIKDADRMEILYFNNGDTLRHKDGSKETIRLFEKVLKNKSNDRICEPSGRINFFTGDTITLRLDFATNATGSKRDCQHLILNEDSWRLTYAVGMYLDETFHELKQSHERNNQNR